MRTSADDEQTANADGASPQRAAEPAPAHVLFVDDEEMLVVLGVHILQLLGYRATGCRSGREALRLFAGDARDVATVISDLSMPEISGFELVRQLHVLRPGLPVLLMSGYLGKDEAAIAARLGVSELLLKPVAIEDLRRALTRAIAGQAVDGR